MDTDAIALILELAGRSTAEREEYYAQRQVPAAVREELESLLLFDENPGDSLSGHQPSAELRALFTSARPHKPAPSNATGSRHPVVIGRYEVVRLLGRGGMAEVFLARDPILDRDIAVKLIGGELDDDVARRKLVQEARAAGRLRHPNIVTIFDAGEHDGRSYIAMEYVPGETLRSLIHRRAELPLRRRLELVEGACAGLAHAHRAGVVHLDVKPDNLMLDDTGIVKVLDFGIARVLKSEVVITRHIVGTLRYMSPEQVAGRPMDRRSDVFSLGCSFFELVAYSPAYDGSTQEIVTRIAAGPVPRLIDVVPGIDPRLDAIAARAMALDPSDRYEDLEELRLELGRLRAEIDPLDDVHVPQAIPIRSQHTPAMPTPAGHAASHQSSHARGSAPVWRVRSMASIGAVAGLAAGAAAFWVFGGPGVEPRMPTVESGIGATASSDTTSGSQPILTPAPAESARVEQPAPAVTPANEEVWRRLALGDREGVLQVLRSPAADRGVAPDVQLGSTVLKVVRTSVLQARRTAGAAPESASLEPYRSAEERLARADGLEAAGRTVDALGALWQAADLYAQSIEIGQRQPSRATSEPQVSIPPGPVVGSDRVAQPALLPGAESVQSEPVTAPPVDTPSSATGRDSCRRCSESAVGRGRDSRCAPPVSGSL